MTEGENSSRSERWQFQAGWNGGPQSSLLALLSNQPGACSWYCYFACSHVKMTGFAGGGTAELSACVPLCLHATSHFTTVHVFHHGTLAYIYTLFSAV